MKQTEINSIFVTCPKGLHYVLESELKGFGASALKATPAGVSAEVDKSCLYRILLWSRVANRVILQLKEGKINQADDVYDIAMSVEWQNHFCETNTFSVAFLGTNTEINNSTYGALKVKDAIVDQFRQQTGIRPSVDKTEPQIRITARLHKDRLSLGLDLSGESLHKRAYRSATGQAPLKENLAAGLLALSGWPTKFKDESSEFSSSFVDPMCGSGTLLIEAAMIATHKAPGLDRPVWGFDAWLQHDSRLWLALVSAAQDSFIKGKQEFSGRIVGFDQDGLVISRAWENIRRAGFEDLIHVEKRELMDFSLFEKMSSGLVLTNPPYGERLGEVNDLKSLYQLLGLQFEQHLLDWQAGIFTGNLDLGRSVGWRSFKQYKLFNGAIESQLLLFDLKEDNRFKEAWQSPDIKIQSPSYWKITHSERAKMFENRLNKNLKNIGKWAKKNKVDCYRLYDADMPEFSLAIDVYQSEEGLQRLHVQEYAPPKTIDEAASFERLREALFVLSQIKSAHLSITPEQIVLKTRAIQKGASQYEKNAISSDGFVVRENSARLNVNLTDYLDTGLFLDHRPMRAWVKENSKGKRFLNLFCYTGAVTVSAAIGGASESLSIDMSKTYLGWAKDNLSLNQLDLSKHKLKQQDCIEWLNSTQMVAPFDLIFLDPPSFSNSKRMQGVLDIQRDHVDLINAAMKHLAKGGQLIFSNNLRKFKLDPEVIEQYKVSDFSKRSIDKDFERNSRIHQCWLIERESV